MFGHVIIIKNKTQAFGYIQNANCPSDLYLMLMLCSFLSPFFMVLFVVVTGLWLFFAAIFIHRGKSLLFSTLQFYLLLVLTLLLLRVGLIFFIFIYSLTVSSFFRFIQFNRPPDQWYLDFSEIANNCNYRSFFQLSASAYLLM